MIKCPQYNVLIVGAKESGKSALLSRFCHNKFLEKYEPTLCDEYNKTIEIKPGQQVSLKMIDTPGEDEMGVVEDIKYKLADGFMIVFDLTSRRSFDDINNKISFIKNLRPIEKVPFFLVGNKKDLEDRRTVTKKEAKDKASSFSAVYFEATSKELTTVLQLFKDFATHIFESKNSPNYKPPEETTGNSMDRARKFSIVAAPSFTSERRATVTNLQEIKNRFGPLKRSGTETHVAILKSMENPPNSQESKRATMPKLSKTFEDMGESKTVSSINAQTRAESFRRAKSPKKEAEKKPEEKKISEENIPQEEIAQNHHEEDSKETPTKKKRKSKQHSNSENVVQEEQEQKKKEIEQEVGDTQPQHENDPDEVPKKSRKKKSVSKKMEPINPEEEEQTQPKEENHDQEEQEEHQNNHKTSKKQQKGRGTFCK